jgi:DNA-binding HxlR family transcriptional regulator
MLENLIVTKKEKTSPQPSAARRSYEQYCAVAKALDVIGERWTLLILRDLVHLGPRRYTDLLKSLPGIGTNLLASRLRLLEEAGIVQRRRLPPPAATTAYELTEMGRGLEPALIAIGRWGGQFMAERQDCDVFVPTGHISGMRAVFDPDRAANLSIDAELRVDGEPLAVSIHDGTLDARQGPADHPDLVVEIDLDPSIDVMLRRVTPTAAIADGDARVVVGTEEDFTRLIDAVAWVP